MLSKLCFTRYYKYYKYFSFNFSHPLLLFSSFGSKKLPEHLVLLPCSCLLHCINTNTVQHFLIQAEKVRKKLYGRAKSPQFWQVRKQPTEWVSCDLFLLWTGRAIWMFCAPLDGFTSFHWLTRTGHGIWHSEPSHSFDTTEAQHVCKTWLKLLCDPKYNIVMKRV